MLIDKGLGRGDIVTIKLSSGEELIAKYISEGDFNYVVSKPMVLGDTGNGVGFYPFLITSGKERDIPLSKSLVSVILPTDEPFSSNYQTATTSIKLV